MGMVRFCTGCHRDVYVSADDGSVCPVCSSPLLELAPALGSLLGATTKGATNLKSWDGQDSVADLLGSWLQEHKKRGGDFCEGALEAARAVAIGAQEAGWTIGDSFEAGRTAYFEEILGKGHSSPT